MTNTKKKLQLGLNKLKLVIRCYGMLKAKINCFKCYKQIIMYSVENEYSF